MARLRLTLLGGFEARLDGGSPIALARHKAAALLARLAVDSGQLHRRDTLAALLWADAPGPRARQSLRQALAELRVALAPAPCLIEQRDAVGLDAGAVDVDVPEFERLVTDGSPEALERGMSLYRGDLLEGLRIEAPAFEEWLMTARERLRELALEALARLLGGYVASNAPGRAVQAAIRLLAIDPLQESVHRTLMRLYLRLGRRGAGLRQYQTCLDLLRRELGTQPERETRLLYLELLQAPSAPDLPAARGDAIPIPTAEAIHPAPLLGREADLTWLGRAYEAARQGHRSVIAIVGEGGTGKTRLIGEFVATLPPERARVLIGRGHETESDLPYGVWIHMFRESGVMTDLAALMHRTPWLRRELARLFPELTEPGAVPSVSADRGALFEAMGQVVAGLARSELVLVLEDLHWADEPSLRLLAFLVRRISGDRLRVVLSARVEEMPGAPALRQVLAELDREGLARARTLPPLARDATTALVRAMAHAAADPTELGVLSEDIWRVSEGNAFMIVETMRALQDGARPGSTEGLPLPRRVHDTIVGRLDRLSDQSRHLAGVAAAFGRPVDFVSLQEGAGLDAGDAARAVEELVGRRILHVVSERLDFTHDWIRRTVYERLLPPVRPVVHASIARALEARHADRLDAVTDDLAYHYSRANEPAKAVEALRRFADAACARYAFEEALRSLDEAMVHADRLPSAVAVRARIDIALQIAFALSVVGRFEEIRGRLEPMRDAVAELADAELSGQYLSRVALTESVLGQHARAEETARRALAEAGRSDDATTLGTARYVLAIKGFVNGEARPGLEQAQQAVAALERAGDLPWLAQACWILGCNHFQLGELDAAVEAVSRMEVIAERLGDRGRQATAAWSIAWFEGTRGEVEAARDAGRRALTRSPDSANRATAAAILAMLDVEAGDASRAIAVLDGAVRDLDRFRLRQAATLSFLAEAYRRDGALADARQAAERTREMGRQMSFAWAEAVAERLLGRIALDARDVMLARRHLETARHRFAAIPAGFELGRTHLDLALAASVELPVIGVRREHRSHVGRAALSLDAPGHVQAAQRLFTAARAPRYLARVERLAAELGIRVPM